MAEREIEVAADLMENEYHLPGTADCVRSFIRYTDRRIAELEDTLRDLRSGKCRCDPKVLDGDEVHQMHCPEQAAKLDRMRADYTKKLATALKDANVPIPRPDPEKTS